jgi:hypothetical protein
MMTPEEEAAGAAAGKQPQSGARAGEAQQSPEPLQLRSSSARSCCCGCCASIRAELRAGAPGAPPARDWRLWFAPPSGAARRLGLSARAVLALRILLALFVDAVLFGSVTLMSAQHEGYWCIYLTHWTLVAVCAHLTLSTCAAAAAHASLARGDPPHAARPPWLPVLWSAQAIALPGSLLVFVLFWCVRGAARPCACTRCDHSSPRVTQGACVPWHAVAGGAAHQLLRARRQLRRHGARHGAAEQCAVLLCVHLDGVAGVRNHLRAVHNHLLARARHGRERERACGAARAPAAERPAWRAADVLCASLLCAIMPPCARSRTCTRW